VTLGLTQSLTGMSTRKLYGGKARPAHKADNKNCELIVQEMCPGRHNPVGLHGLLQGVL
jgi:hypothetical protein